jgi:hypothetical protein
MGISPQIGAAGPLRAVARPEAAPPRRQAPAASAWIESPGFDTTFFVLGPVLTLPLALGALYVHNAFALAGLVLAFAHYVSSFTFYFWDENRPHHRRRWVSFYAGPLLVAGTLWLLVAYRVPLVIQVALFFWNAVHVSRQSCGVLSLYRHRAGVSDPRQKQVANGAILAANLWFCLWNIETHAEVQPLLAALSPRLPQLVWALCGALAVGALARAVLAFRARAAQGRPAPLPELALFVASLALFHPYLWIRDSGRATFAMLLPHYVQYLALVWLLQRRKLRGEQGSAAQQALRRLSQGNAALVVALAAVGLGFFAIKELLAVAGQAALFDSLFLLLAFVHFYVDGLFWAFRDPHVRRSIGPYLTQGAPGPAGAPAARTPLEAL